MRRAFKAWFPNPPSHLSLFQGEDSCNMDGFYDQQVPFVVPESVSLKHYIKLHTFIIPCKKPTKD